MGQTKKCAFCGAEFEAKSQKGRFCSAKHRVYWNRDNKKDRPPKQQSQNEDDVIREITRIMAEKIPDGINTPLGRKVWLADKERRIEELKRKLS